MMEVMAKVILINHFLHYFTDFIFKLFNFYYFSFNNSYKYDHLLILFYKFFNVIVINIIIFLQEDFGYKNNTTQPQTTIYSSNSTSLYDTVNENDKAGGNLPNNNSSHTKNNSNPKIPITEGNSYAYNNPQGNKTNLSNFDKDEPNQGQGKTFGNKSHFNNNNTNFYNNVNNNSNPNNNNYNYYGKFKFFNNVF